LDQYPTVLGCFEYGPEISSDISKDSHALPPPSLPHQRRVAPHRSSRPHRGPHRDLTNSGRPKPVNIRLIDSADSLTRRRGGAGHRRAAASLCRRKDTWTRLTTLYLGAARLHRFAAGAPTRRRASTPPPASTGPDRRRLRSPGIEDPERRDSGSDPPTGKVDADNPRRGVSATRRAPRSHR